MKKGIIIVGYWLAAILAILAYGNYLLGTEFIRIHRAFLVNRADAVLSAPDTVTVNGQELPVSRKYKEEVSQLR